MMSHLKTSRARGPRSDGDALLGDDAKRFIEEVRRLTTEGCARDSPGGEIESLAQ